MEETIRDGWLHKMSHNKLVSNKFQRRFFVLTSQTLKYAKTPEAMDEECDPYPLAGAQWVRPLKIANQFADFEVQFPKKVLKLKGLDPADTQAWFEEIEHAIKKVQQTDLDHKDSTSSAKDASLQGTGMRAHDTSQTSGTSNSTLHQQQLSTDTVRSDSHNKVHAAAVGYKGNTAIAHDDEVLQQEYHGHDDLPRRPPSPPRVPSRLPYKSLPKGAELDLSAGEVPGREEVEEGRPSPRSMLANPHRFGTLAATSSPKQRPSPPLKVQQAMEHDESGSESGEEPFPHTRNHPGVKGPLSADSLRMSATSHLSAREGSMGSVRASADALHAGRERPSSGVAERLSRTLPPRGSLRPRLLQPDAPLPEATSKPGLHHAISMQKQHSSDAQESERLELPDRPAHTTAAAQPRSGTGSSRSSARSSARPPASNTHDPESEALVLGPTEGGPHAAADRVSLNRSGGGSLNRSGGSSGGTHGNASMHSSLGSARAAPPRLLSGAAARAPTPQDERIELPPSRFPPKAPPAPAAPPTEGRGRQQKEAAPNSVGYDREELEENWDSDEGGEREEDQQARQQQEEQERAKAEFLARQQQEQEQLEQEQQERASRNSWDEDEDDANGDTRGSRPKASVPSQPRGKPASQRPTVAKAAPQDAENTNSRDVPAHVQAGVTVDKNFAEENWDSDEE